MAKNQKGIFVTDTEFQFIRQAKAEFEAATGAKISWGAYLWILSAGALAIGATFGMNVRCPDCGHTSEITFKPLKTSRPTE